MKNLIRTTFLCASCMLPLSGQAADALTEAIQKAYPPYRAALYKTNGKSQAEAREVLDQAREGWARVASQFGVRPPSPYDLDRQLPQTFDAIDKAYAKASGEVEQNKLGKAHETLEEVRDLLADLRRRNGVIVYSDHMNAYHTAMEDMVADGADLLAKPDGKLRLMARVGVLDYLARNLKSEASREQAANAEFAELAKGVAKSVADLEAALLADKEEAVKEAINALKKPYSRMFLKFG
jgi:hypothetical protein